jgi:uncharacterized protein
MSQVKRILDSSRQGVVVCERATLANHPLSRMRGLLGKRTLSPEEGLLLTPAPSIHTAFMRFDIDVLFLDRDLRVMRVVERLPPWKAAASRHARSVLELPAGHARHVGVEVGDRLELVGTQPETHREPNSTTQPNAGSVRAVSTPPEHARPLTHRVRLHGRGGSAPAVERHEQQIRVLVLSPDRYFREVVSMLLARRDCVVSVEDRRTATLAERIDRERTEVVVIDAERSLTTAAQIVAAVQALSTPVGIVVVDDQIGAGISRLKTVPKWGAFDALYTAVERAHSERALTLGMLGQAINGAGS